MHTTALLLSVKRLFFCVGNSMKMVNHDGCTLISRANDHKGTLADKAKFQGEFKASQTGENSQSNAQNTLSYAVF